jgi:hypothetical protein
MHRSAVLGLAVLPGLLSAPSLQAQNLVPEGEFHEAGANWTRTAFSDPLGNTGFAAARVAAQGPSMAVYANFQTLNSVMSATFRSQPVALPPVPLPVGFRVMWEKPVSTPIPQPSVNRVELRLIDAVSNNQVLSISLPAPNQSGFLERNQFAGLLNVPAAGVYFFDLFLRHSNLANIPFVCWVDDLYVGGLTTEVFGQGCPGTGGITPTLSSSGPPTIGTSGFAIELHDAVSPGFGFFVLDATNATWAGGPLPFDLGGGCNLLVGTTVSVLHLIQGGGPGLGTSRQVFPMPANPAFAGNSLFAQWGVVDPAAQNAYGLCTSPALRFTLQ